MPFTPAHAVVALPFVRTPLLPAAVAVGAMAPDLPLFLRGTPLTYQVTHTNLVVTVVLAFVLLAGWYLVLRPAVRELIPRVLAARLPREWDAGGLSVIRTVSAPRERAAHPIWGDAVRFPILLVVSLLIGALSHVVWDAFTHEGRWGVQLVPVLAAQWGPLCGYKWLQHGSSIVGVTALAIWGLIRLARSGGGGAVDRSLPNGVRWAWWLSLPVILAIAWFTGLAARGPFTEAFTPQHLGYLVLPPACAVWGVITIVLCVMVQVLRRR